MATLYDWKAKFGVMGLTDAKRLKPLEYENAKLKKLLAEQMLDAAALRELLAKNGRACRQTRSRRASTGRIAMSHERSATSRFSFVFSPSS